jgi:Zn-dependent peptidase ImmA (M78 family)
LAQHLGISFRSADELVPREALEELNALQAGCFSACTLQGRTGPVVVINPLNSTGRQMSDAMHELSHIILRHHTKRLERVAGLVFFTGEAQQEEEADHLGATLLLPRPLLDAALEQGLSVAAIADQYGVSEQLARWRVNGSGAALQFQRRKSAKRTA